MRLRFDTGTAIILPFGETEATSTFQNPTIIGASTLAAGVYSVNATALGCTGANGTVNVVVNTTPTVITIGSNSPICSGQTLSLTATSTVGATFNWSGPNSFTSTFQNPTIIGASTLAAGVYSVNATALGCTGANGTVNVVVNPIPATPTPGSNSPICEGQTLNLTTPLVLGATYSWTGPNSFSSTLQNPSIVATTSLAAGVYSLGVTVLGCSSAIGTVTVIVNPIPASVVVGSNSPLCAGQTLSLTASTIIGATYNWSGPNSFTAAVQNPTIVSTTTLATGVYSVNVTVLGCTGSSATLSILVDPPVPAPVAGSNSPICEGQPLLLTAGTVPSATYNWFGPNSFTSSVQNPTIVTTTTLSSGIYSVQATVGGCTGPFGTISVTVNPTPAAPVAGSNAPLCEGQTLLLTAGTISGATYNWSGPNSFTSAIQNPTIVSTPSLAAGIYTVSATLGVCTGPTSTISVIVNPLPAPVVVGSNSPLCTGQTLSLTASTIVGATYLWAGPASFTSTNPNPTIPSVTLLEAGTYSVNVTVLGCTGSNATISIVINPTPATPTVGSNSPICDGQTLNLTSSLVAGATYSWSGPNTFTSSVQNPSITPASTLATGVYSVNVTLAGCTGPDGTVSVVVNPIPLAPSASANTPLCTGNTLSLTAGTTTGATYSWTGPNTFTSNIQNPTITGATTLATGVYSVNITVLGCTGPDGTVSVLITDPGIVNAGPDGNVCSTAPFVTLSGTVTPGYTTTWTSLGTGTLTSPNTLITNYIMSNADTLAGSITFILTASGGGCPNVSDTVVYTILPAANTNAGPNQNVCKNGVIPLSGIITGVTTTGYWTSTGTGTFVTDTTASATYYQPSSADTTGNQTIYLILTSTNNGGCAPSIDTLIATFINAPKASFTYSNACANQPVLFNNTSTPTASISTYNWNFGDASGVSTAQNPTYTYTVGNTYTVTLVATSVNGCTDTTRQAVTIFIAPTANFTYSNVCVGAVGVFVDASTVTSGTITTWVWNFGNGGTSNIQNPFYTYTVGGTYSVNLTVTSSNGCTGTVVKSLTVNPKPKADFSMSANPIYADESVTYNDLSTPVGSIITWNWNLGDGSTSTQQNPSYIYDDKGIFTVQLAIIDANGCVDTVRKQIFVTLLPMLPTGFSPNGDGKNDTLFVKGGPFKSFYFRVYNNWGEKIFESTEQENGWDGTYKGQYVPLGAYAWILDVVLYNDNEKAVRKTGDVTIIK